MTFIPIHCMGSDLLEPIASGTGNALTQALRGSPKDQPVVIMVHGYKYDSQTPGHIPADTIYSPTRLKGVPRAVSWPHHLRLDRHGAIGVGFSWPARGTIFEARRKSSDAAIALARLIRSIHTQAPLRPIHIMAHSLGARVALLSLHRLPMGALSRMVLLAPAAFRHEAEKALGTPAGRAAEVFNMTSRENDIYDLMLESLYLRPALGQGLRRPRPNWINIQIDHRDTRAALKGLGFPTRPPNSRICHWSSYLRPGLFSLYRRLFFGPAPLLMHDIRAALPRKGEPRLARLREYPIPFLGRPTSS